jgi:bile acid-coenzyme A ligase
MKVFDAGMTELPPGEVGEIYMKRAAELGPSYRYIGAEPRSQGAWESLGDMGWFDEDGYLYLTDRRADMILVGGVNIYPAEVESALERHPLVQSSAVIGLPDDDSGTRVHAILEAPSSLDLEELRAHLGQYLTVYKIPRSFEFVSTALRDDAGKVRRSQLRQERLALDAPTTS